MKILITGASGFIGTALTQHLLAAEHQVIGLSRKPELLQEKISGQFRAVKDLAAIDASEEIEAIINLAGEPILDKRWSEARKELIYNSRLDITASVIELVKRLDRPPGVLVSGSAIGFYGSHAGDRMLDERSEGRPGFTHKLCADWESKALEVQSLGVRVCLLRTGVVLGQGGALQRMLPAFKFALGGPIGSGKQWFSWVHLDDMVAIIEFLLVHEVLTGVFNATAPEPVTNAVFTQALGRALHRPALLPMPGFVLRLILGEGAELLCEGQRVVPVRLQEAGFEFAYPDIDQALKVLC
ncbi:MAG: TIGR01777 family oxidoreductase [Motiliproteus sp.]